MSQSGTQRGSHVVDPRLVDSGHGRCEIASELGEKQVPSAHLQGKPQ